MPDIFGRSDQVYGGGLSSDASWMFWSAMANGGLGMLIHQVSTQYQQPVRRIFEIGPWKETIILDDDLNEAIGVEIGQPVYYVVGRPEGQISIARIVGPVSALGGFYKLYGNPCTANNSLFFTSTSGCIGGGTTTFSDGILGWYMTGVILTSIGLTMQSQDMLVNEQVQCMFVGLKLYIAPITANGNVGAWKQL